MNRRSFTLKRVFGAALAMMVAGCADPAPPSPVPTAMPEQEVSAGDLHGARLSAGDDAPLVLIIPGSGPTDRDGNSPSGLNSDAYKLLAEALFDRGVSTVRVDKRGMFTSAGAGNANDVTVEAYASDYATWIESRLSDRPQSCLFLLGHSEGGVMAMATAINRQDVCGLILLATPGRALDEVLIEQLNANPANAPILDQAFDAIDSLKNGENVDTTGLHPALGRLFHANVQGFLISMMRHDPVALLEQANLPTLIVQGGTDLQVSLDDARRLATVENTELVTLTSMNHVLKEATPDRADNLRTYYNPDLPLAPGLADAIAGFVLE